MNQNTEKTDIRTRFGEFFARFRTPLIVAGAAIVLGLLAFFIGSEVRDSRMQSALALTEEAQSKFDEWSGLDAESEEASSAVEELRATVEEILATYPRSYAAQRALFIQGNLRFELGLWTEAAESFEVLAERFPESHLAPVALSSAAAALEEANDSENAVRLWESIVERYGQDAAEAPRALFSLGRLAEGAGAFQDAGVQYNRLLDGYPASSWTNLARNRIVYLTTEGLIGS